MLSNEYIITLLKIFKLDIGVKLIMKVTLEDINDTQKKLEVSIPADLVTGKRAEIFDELKRNASIKGFRPGKAPDKVIENMYGKSIRQEVASKLVSDSLENALKEVDLSPINRPDVNPGEVQPGEEFQYTVEFEIIPKFELSEYNGLKLKKKKIDVKKKDIDNTLKEITERSAQAKLVEEDRKVKKGDIVVVDFEGQIEGNTVKDLKQEDTKFAAGEGQLIKEFDDNIIGLKRGKEKKFDVSYEDDFQIKEAAGKTVNYTIKLKEIHEKIVPKANAEFAKGIGFETLKELNEKIKEDLTAQQERTEQGNLKEQIINIFDKDNDFSVPDVLINDEAARLQRDFSANFQSQGAQMPEIDETGLAKFREIAAKNVKSSIIFAQIAKKEDIKPASNDVQNKLHELSAQLQVPMENLMQVYQDKNMMANIESAVTEEKVIEFIKEKANIVEELEQETKIDNDE